MRDIAHYMIAILLCSALTWIAAKWYYELEHKDFVYQVNAASEKAKQKQEFREKELQGVIAGLLEESHENTAKLEASVRDNAKLVAERGGLRDPGNTCGGRYKSKNSSAGGNTNSSGGAKLSDETIEFLLTFAADADRIRERLLLCQRWAKAVSSH